MVTIATIVEGHGEVEAVPLLLRRIVRQPTDAIFWLVHEESHKRLGNGLGIRRTQRCRWRNSHRAIPWLSLRQCHNMTFRV